MSLRQYQSKRRFSETPEPAGSIRKAKGKLEFVVQKHRASHLHYDFRLEVGGVLKSWAVPKGPSLNPKDKRLAMMVEDHPFEYRKFEGVIPNGNYGAGNVIIWDRGTYEPYETVDDAQKAIRHGLKKGHLNVVLHGQKLKGAFALIKNERMQKNAWLLVKKDDEFAQSRDITKEDKSVVSGNTVETVSGEADTEADLASAPKSDMPRRVKPMLATLVNQSFSDKDWLFEIKWDGYRAIGGWDGKKCELYSRNGNDFSRKYPPVSEALRALGRRLLLDGEVAAVDGLGRSRFGWLQNYSKQPQGHLVYYAFDILWCEGRDLRDWPLLKRKELLRKLLPEDSIIKYSDHITEKGEAFFKEAQRQNLEGIIAKKTDSTYSEGVRSKQWLKIKTHMRQEAVIGGFTEPRGSRKHIGALILGVYEDDKLIYVGHTGGGIPTALLPKLRKKLEALERKTSPFSHRFKPNAPVHWVTPQLICEVSFSEWTDEGHMRHPIFEGLRADKDPKSITKERPKAAAQIKRQAEQEPMKQTKSKIKFSHLDKIFWPEASYTKGDLIEYYQTVGKTMLPYLKDRPHSLLRHPNGYKGDSFFQKDVDHMPPDWVQTKEIYSESNKKDINYLVCNSVDTLLYMAQLGCIEINPWNSRVGVLEKPDWVVLDLDPEDIEFKHVIETAKTVHQLCEELKIASYPKTSGKTGIHIYIPLNAEYDYEQAKQFGEILANLVQQRLPDITSVERSPKKRRGKIYVDFLQNRKGQTLAAPYSVRPTPEATVSTPLHWDEVNSRLDPKKFVIKNTPARLKKAGDIWGPVLGKGVDIKKAISALS